MKKLWIAVFILVAVGLTAYISRVMYLENRDRRIRLDTEHAYREEVARGVAALRAGQPREAMQDFFRARSSRYQVVDQSEARAYARESIELINRLDMGQTLLRLNAYSVAEKEFADFLDEMPNCEEATQSLREVVQKKDAYQRMNPRPDKIVFEAYHQKKRHGMGSDEWWVMNADGYELRPLHLPTYTVEAVLSPDGSTLVAISDGEDDVYYLNSLDIEGSHWRILSHESLSLDSFEDLGWDNCRIGGARWSANSKDFLFWVTEDGFGKARVFCWDTDANVLTVLFDIDPGGGVVIEDFVFCSMRREVWLHTSWMRARWSSSGTYPFWDRLYVATETSSGLIISARGHHAEGPDAKGSYPEESCDAPSFAANGMLSVRSLTEPSQFLVSGPDRGREIWEVDKSADEYLRHISPDGKWLLFGSSSDRGADLFTIDVDSGTKTKIISVGELLDATESDGVHSFSWGSPRFAPRSVATAEELGWIGSKLKRLVGDKSVKRESPTRAVDSEELMSRVSDDLFDVFWSISSGLKPVTSTYQGKLAEIVGVKLAEKLAFGSPAEQSIQKGAVRLMFAEDKDEAREQWGRLVGHLEQAVSSEGNGE